MVSGGGDVNLAVHEAGDPDGAPIVFLHGITMNHLAWEEQFAGDLADEFRLIALDLRGHGASDTPTGVEHYADSAVWAEDVAAVIDDHDLERPVLVGWSYGGLVIADYLRAFGDEDLGGVVFVAAVTDLGTPEAMAQFSDEFLEVSAGLVSTEVATMIDATREFVHMLTLEPLDRGAFEVVFGGSMMVPPEVRLALVSRELENDDVLAASELPTLVLHGAEDEITILAASERIAEIAPEAELIIYEGIGHAPFMEAPERFDRDLAEFVRDVR